LATIQARPQSQFLQGINAGLMTLARAVNAEEMAWHLSFLGQSCARVPDLEQSEYGVGTDST
jgi:hypothetical protein